MVTWTESVNMSITMRSEYVILFHFHQYSNRWSYNRATIYNEAKYEGNILLWGRGAAVSDDRTRIVAWCTTYMLLPWLPLSESLMIEQQWHCSRKLIWRQWPHGHLLFIDLFLEKQDLLSSAGEQTSDRVCIGTSTHWSHYNQGNEWSQLEQQPDIHLTHLCT